MRRIIVSNLMPLAGYFEGSTRCWLPHDSGRASRMEYRVMLNPVPIATEDPYFQLSARR